MLLKSKNDFQVAEIGVFLPGIDVFNHITPKNMAIIKNRGQIRSLVIGHCYVEEGSQLSIAITWPPLVPGDIAAGGGGTCAGVPAVPFFMEAQEVEVASHG